MNNAKFYKGILSLIVIIISLVAVWYAIRWPYNHPLLFVIVLLICPLLAFLIYKNPEFKIANYTTHTIVTFILVINSILTFIGFFGSNREIAYLKKFFYGGKIKTEEITLEDSEGNDVPGTEYSNTKGGSGDTFIYLGYMISLGLVYVTYKIQEKIPVPPKKPSSNVSTHDPDW